MIFLLIVLLFGIKQPILTITTIWAENLTPNEIIKDTNKNMNESKKSTIKSEINKAESSSSSALGKKSKDEILSNPPKKNYSASNNNSATVRERRRLLMLSTGESTDSSTGLWGTAPYQWDASNGVLTIEAGDLQNKDLAPYNQGAISKTDIKKIIFTGSVFAPINSSSLFGDLSKLSSIEGLTYLDTSKVSIMYAMFYGASSLTSLDLSKFDTSNVTSMSFMFNGASSLTSLDLSKFDTSKVTDMTCMFYSTQNLQSLILGRNFKFGGNAQLSDVPNNHDYNGKWNNIGKSNNPKQPLGKNLWSSSEFMSNYDGSKDADTYVWQPVGLYFNQVIDNFSFPQTKNNGEKQTVKLSQKGALSLIDALPLSNQNTQLLVAYNVTDDDWQKSGLSLKLNASADQSYVTTQPVTLNDQAQPLISQFDESQKKEATLVKLDLEPEVTLPVGILPKDYTTSIVWTIQQGPS